MSHYQSYFSTQAGGQDVAYREIRFIENKTRILQLRAVCFRLVSVLLPCREVCNSSSPSTTIPLMHHRPQDPSPLLPILILMYTQPMLPQELILASTLLLQELPLRLRIQPRPIKYHPTRSTLLEQFPLAYLHFLPPATDHVVFTKPERRRTELMTVGRKHYNREERVPWLRVCELPAALGIYAASAVALRKDDVMRNDDGLPDCIADVARDMERRTLAKA
jgi:hypothetical protein